MMSNEIMLIGSALFVAYLAYSNSKLNKKISNLKSEIASIRKSKEEELSQIKSVKKSAFNTDKNSKNKQLQDNLSVF